MMKSAKRCEMTMEFWDFRPNFYSCDRPAKYIAPTDPMTKKNMYVCGIHKNSVDAFQKRIGSKERCKKLSDATKGQ